MKNIISHLFFCCVLVTGAFAQTKTSISLTSHGESTLFGFFEGRTPCQEIARELNLKVRPECDKRKVWLTLYQDSITHQPTTYKIGGMGEKSGEGRWHIVKGIPTDAEAIVYQLDMKDVVLNLYKGDENVLFFLDKDKNFLPGNARFSYTLNKRIGESIPWEQRLPLKNKGY